MNTTACPPARAALVLFLTGSLTASAAVFSTDTFITADDTNYAGAEIIVSNCRLTIDGVHSFARLELQPGSELTHSPGVSGLRLTVAGDVIVSQTARVNLDAKGHPGSVGPGSGATGGAPPSGSGASHGGFGGKSAGGATSPALVGYYTSATAMGGGGGSGSGGVGGNGGGAIQLVAGGTMRLDGLISAGGGDAVNARSGGGAGGSVSISASAFVGSGVITADGGRGEPSEGGGGSGGRIAIQADTNLFAGRFSATGGAGYEWGGPGTVWQQPRNQPLQGKLLVDNGGRPGRTILSVSSPIEVNLGGGVHANVGSQFAAAHLHMRSNSWLTFSNKTSIFVEREAVLDHGSGILADAAASPAEKAGLGGTYGGAYGLIGGGGGHGGFGGDGSLTNARGGTAYYTQLPATTGSAGGGQPGAGGNGGGALGIDVTGTFICNGVLSANGGDATAPGGGGGSGGSVWVRAGLFAGAGEIRANGGNGSTGLYTGGGGGGGGRIFVETGTNIFLGKMTAYGGDGARIGGAGTVYTSVKNFRRLVVDNAGKAGTNTTWMYISGADAVIRGGARLRPVNWTSLLFGSLEIGSNSWLQLGRYGTSPWVYSVSVSSHARIDSGGGITSDGAGQSAGSGAGAGRGDFYKMAAGGGGYGGRGGAGGADGSTATAGGNSYGSLSSPGEVGSGGGTFSSSIGGAGGGGISVNVTGTLLLDGVISANGLAATGVGGGGGSGGALRLTVGTLAGRGLISANGGAGAGLGGGGGGGRIAITATANAFSGQWTAFGGAGYNAGGAGTIFVRSAGSSRDDLVIIGNAGRTGTNTPLSNLPPVRISVTEGGAALLSGQQITLNGLRIGPGASVVITNSLLYVNGDVVIERGGAILSDGAGSASGQGPGAGKYHLAMQAADGGGYGGYGVGVGGAVSGGKPYGQMSTPRDPGSGGGTAGSVATSGGAGGGVVAFTVNGAMVVDGLISANGLPASAAGAGGGSGGSVWISANNLSGSGLITANGGDGSGRGGGGGGGRISFSAYASAFAGSVTAHGGRGGGSWGGAGTIHLSGRGRAAPLVQVENGGHTGFQTLITPTGNRYDLTVLSGGIAAVPSLTVSNLFIGPGGALTASQSGTNFHFVVEGHASVALGGRISVNGRGYGPNIGPGRGALENMIGSGAGHGGAGGASSLSPGGAAYGSVNLPAEPGSGGGAVGIGTGSEGGGALRLRVGGTLVVDGEITADGNDALVDAAGGGSGGSIWIDANALYGTGLIAVRGGAGEPWLGGGGGGGRIAIYSPNQLFLGVVTASGGPGFEPGKEGSVFYSGLRVLPLIVTGHSPSGSQTQSVNAVEIVFNTPLRPETLSLVRPTLLTPGGSETNLTVSLAAAPDRLRVSFPTQSVEGAYTLVLPPGVQNEFGETVASTYFAQFQIVVPGVGVTARVSAGTLLLSWHGLSGETYQPVISTNLTHWSAWGPPIPCTSPGASLGLELPLDAAPKRFFKILQVR